MVTMLLVQWLRGGGAPARDVNIVVVAIREAVIIIVTKVIINIKCIKCETEGLLIVGLELPGLQLYLSSGKDGSIRISRITSRCNITSL